MSKTTRDTEIKLFGRTITSVNHYDHSKEASSSSSSSCSPSTEPNRVLANQHEQHSSRFEDPYILSDLNEPSRAASKISSPRSSKKFGL